MLVSVSTGWLLSRRASSVHMASRSLKPRRRQSCCAGGPNGLSCINTQHTDRISIHRFPKNSKVRKQWIDFVQRHRSGWKPTNTSILCSLHFVDSCFTTNHQIASSLGIKNILTRDTVPTIDVAVSQPDTKPFTSRHRRYIWKLLFFDFVYISVRN